MLRRRLFIAYLCAGFLGLTVPGGTVARAEVKPSIEPHAEELLKAALTFLAKAPSITFHAEVTKEVPLSSGVKVLHTGTLEMAVRRPDRISYKRDDDEALTTGTYDGALFTLHDVGKKTCASWPVKEKLDGLFANLKENLGFQPPLARFLTENVADEALKNVTTGFSAGRSVIRGVACEQLVFRQQNLDWQVWIATEGDPVIRRMVFTHRNDPTLPQSSVAFLDWDFKAVLSDSVFIFQVPQGLVQCEFEPVKK